MYVCNRVKSALHRSKQVRDQCSLWTLLCCSMKRKSAAVLVTMMNMIGKHIRELLLNLGGDVLQQKRPNHE